MSISQTPQITVIIATYNKSETLYHTIESVLWQTFTDFECWVIGDACTDNSESVVASFKDPRLFWHNLEKNSGYQSAPTNEALHRARGRYIAYLNHDDLWLPNHLQVLVDKIEGSETDFVCSIGELINPDGEYAHIPDYPNSPIAPEVSVTLHRRDVLNRIGYWKAPNEIRAIPRVDFFRRAQFTGMTFAIAPYLTVLIFRRVEAGSRYSSLQAYMDQIRQDPDFAAKELAKMLIDINRKFEGPISLLQLRTQLLQSMRRMLLKRGIDPGILKPWLRSGDRIKKWRKNIGLDPK